MRRSDLVSVRFNGVSTINFGGGLTTAGASVFKLDDFAGVDPYKNQYDQYCIKKVKIALRPRPNVVNQNSPDTDAAGGYVIYGLDFDDATNWASVAAATNSWGVKRQSALAPWKKYFTPRVQRTVSLATDTLSTLGATPVRSCWIDTGAGGIRHYGVKYLYTLGGHSADKFTVDVFTTLYVQFKHRTGNLV